VENWNVVFVIVLEKYKKKVCFSQFLFYKYANEGRGVSRYITY
jgi:hypothetical protein